MPPQTQTQIDSDLQTRKVEAEIAKHEAERDKLHNESEYFSAQTREKLAEAEAEEIALRSKRRGEQILLAQDDYHRVYVFDDDVSDASVKKCITYLSTWSRQEPGCDIELHINTPGGSIFAGMALIDYIRGLRDRGHKVTAVAYGMAASMGAVILQAADVRAIGKNSFVLIHEGSLFAVGDYGHVEDEIAMMNKLHERILDIFVERAVVSRARIKRGWKRKDWWLSADEALELGFVDDVR